MSLRATNEGVLKIGDKELPCAVLSDGTRVLTAKAVFQAFDRPRKGRSNDGSRGDQMPSFIDANNLQPFVNEHIKVWTKLIPYQTLSGAKRSGYDARILRGLCEVYLEAKRAGVLLPAQERLAVTSEVLLIALADVGITALIDEATGYQHTRERDELQKLLKAYVSEGLLPWQKRFPDIFYQHLFRLNGWDYTLEGIKKRPGVVGSWTNQLIYRQLPEGVLEEPQRVTPRSEQGNTTERYHQHLTNDIGNVHLTNQIQRVIAIMEVSDNWDDFISKFNKSIQSQADIKKISVGSQVTEKHTTPERDEESELSLFSDSDFS
jgi:hypothetical protein|nr:MAG TPA: P63C domain protein [Caudoviricetes sp.]